MLAVLLVKAMPASLAGLRSSSFAAQQQAAWSWRASRNRRGAGDQQATEVAFALLADVDLTVPAAAAVRLRRQPEPSSELPAGSEQRPIRHHRGDQAGGDRPNAGYRRQAVAHVSGAMPLQYTRLQPVDFLVEQTELVDEALRRPLRQFRHLRRHIP